MERHVTVQFTQLSSVGLAYLPMVYLLYRLLAMRHGLGMLNWEGCDSGHVYFRAVS
jgi:hypothetical protein